MRDKNAYVQNERKRYQINFYSKYSVLAKETNNNNDTSLNPGSTPTANIPRASPGVPPKQRDTRKKHHRKHIMSELVEPGKTTVYIIGGQRRFDLYRDYLQVETRKVKQNFLSVIDWMCLKN